MEIKPGNKPFKKRMAKIIFWFLGRGFAAVAKYDHSVKMEVEEWADGMKILLKIEANGPFMAMEKKDGRLQYVGLKEIESDLTIYIKNIEAAMLILMGRIGISQAFGEHRFTLKGDIAEGMRLLRCLNRVEAYLFPKFITKKILRRIPKKTTSNFKIYMGTIFGVK